MAKRPVTIEWAAAETIVAIGGTLVATASPYRGQKDVALSFPDAAEIGSIFSPDPEIIQALTPDLIFCASWQQGLVPMLSRIAPVHVFDLRTPRDTILDNTVRFIAEVGELIGRQSEARQYQSHAVVTLDSLKTLLAPVAQRSILIGALGPDGRHISVFGKGSLFDSVLTRLGLANAWTGPMNEWGNLNQGIEALAEYPDTPFVYLDSGAPTLAARRALQSSSLWNALPSVQRGNVRPVPFAWLYGGMPTSLRFAKDLASALLLKELHERD